MTVTAEERSGLARAVSRLRLVFEEDFASLAEGKFGIHVSGRRAGEVEDVSALSLSAHDLAARAELVGVIDYLMGEGLGAAEAVERMLREAVFTTVNRLLAIRVAEAIGALPAMLSDATASEGFVEALEVFPLLREVDDSGGYWTYLQICGDELSHAVPRLFDRRHPLSALVPSAEALDQAILILSEAQLADVWAEPEALGWSYQFFNTQDERRAMREASSAPRNSRELAVRNQFFTPRYVVDFLVQNTLGRRLRESGFALDLPLLLGDIDEEAPPLDLNDVSVLDPAVGSGHFLLGAYDLLEIAWQDRGICPEESASRILGSLYGIEIDPRAAQVAQAVLYLRARRSAPGAALEPPTIVTARPLPKDPKVRAVVFSEVPGAVRDIVSGLDENLDQATVLGSLLKPEEYLSEAIGARLEQPQLGDDLPETLEKTEQLVLSTASRIASQESSTPAERLFAADARDALRFVEICARRFDTVLMNPPFGEVVPATRPFLRAAYPVSYVDIYAAFIERGRLFLGPTGYLGAITSRTGLFISSFEQWRREILLPGLVAVADLGFGVLHEALVEAASFVVRGLPSDGKVEVLSLLSESDKEVAMYEGGAPRLTVSDSALTDIPGAPLAYWTTPSVRELYRMFPSLGEAAADVKQGLVTADNFRFVRLWWEVRADDIGRGSRWALFAKGGEYSPHYSSIHLVVDWEDDGRRLLEWGRGRVQNVDYYFRSGVTWPVATTSAFGPYALLEGCIFAHSGNVAFAKAPVSIGQLGAFLTSRLARQLLSPMLLAGEQTSSGTPRNRYEVGLIKSLPWITTPARVGQMWLDVVALIRDRHVVSDETALEFGSIDSGDRQWNTRDLRILELTAEIDEALLREAGVDLSAREAIDVEQGPHPTAYPLEGDVDLEEFARLYEARIDELVDYGVEAFGGARYMAVKSYIVDRRLELLSHLFGIHPRRVLELRDELGLERQGERVQFSDDCLSYLVGVGMGRWDVRIGADRSLAPALGGQFDPLQVCPPGMFTGPGGLPASEAHEGYPLALPPDRILHDDPSHRWDIVRAVEAAADYLFDDADGALREALGHLKAKNLRSYLRSKFFDQHLSRYSKSRRKAPIYWYLAVPSKQWGLWVYAPWLSREQLFAVARAAQDKLRRLAEEADQLRRDLEAGGGREARERLEAVEDLAREVEAFFEKAEAVAQSGWEPDLSDGIILNAAPLEDLFAAAKWRKDVAQRRKKMEKGEYPWATVQQTYFDKLKS